MKKEKKSHRSKILERRRYKTPQSHRRSSESREKHTKHHRSSKSPSSSKRKHEEGKEVESKEVKRSTAKADSRPGEAEPDIIVFENVLNDKGTLIEELFEAVSDDNLKKITPDSLKNCSSEELRIMCLEELNRMSKAEIVHVLSGKDPASFDPSWKTEETKEEEMLHSQVMETKEERKEDVTEKNINSGHSLHPESTKEISASGRNNKNPNAWVSPDDEHESASSVTGDTKSEAESDSLELCATQKEIDSLIQEEILNQTGSQGLAQQTKSDLTDMEILELELRARIIRSLLRSHGMEVSDEEEKIQQKENFRIKERNA